MKVEKQNPAGRRGFVGLQSNGFGLQGEDSRMPIEPLLSRLEGVRKSGKGWACKCPAHEDRSASLSLAQGTDGRVLLRCFAGCEPIAVVNALGLELRDLFPQRMPDLSRQGRIEVRTAWRQTGWQAALNVLGREASVVLIAGRMLLAGKLLTNDDDRRLSLAVERIEGAREVLA